MVLCIGEVVNKAIYGTLCDTSRSLAVLVWLTAAALHAHEHRDSLAHRGEERAVCEYGPRMQMKMVDCASFCVRSAHCRESRLPVGGANS